MGPDYAHAEARKSPALDGKVERDSEGKEIRYPVMLTAIEKLVARKVCVAFKVGSAGQRLLPLGCPPLSYTLWPGPPGAEFCPKAFRGLMGPGEGGCGWGLSWE